ncbi:MAG TPA: DUF2889 domain-containing protein [Candidatus Kryptonia bacterium]|nr:DUF2889 domain-containing protein [Candidatus Kryptonia bacterium]
MRLDVQGHPIHTRTLSATLSQRADRKLDVHGYVLDLRKRGFVPVAGDLQGTGIIHHMLLDAVIDPATATIERIAAQQPKVAFEPSPEAFGVTRGEQCRDPIAAIEAIAGAQLDSGFSRRLSAAIGGPRGCSHLLTLAHLLGSTAAWAIERDRALHGSAPQRPAGQRVFRRDLIIDGFETPEANGTMELAIQLADLHFAPSAAVVRPMDRFAADQEIRGVLTVEFPTFQLSRIAVAERRRDSATFDSAEWNDLDVAVAGLIGLRFGFGITAELLQRLDERAADRPLLDALLMVAPALIQCTAALSDSWPAAFKRSESLVGMGGLPDSCYMWRRDGALSRAREAEGGVPPRRP